MYSLTDNPVFSRPLTELKGIGPATAASFQKLHITTVGELLKHYPRKYEYLAKIVPAASAAADETVSLKLVLSGEGSAVRFGRRSVLHFKGSDGTENVRLTYFNAPYLKKSLHSGSCYVFRGRLKKAKNGSLFMEQPKIYKEEEYAGLEGTYLPLYPLVRGLKNHTVLSAVRKAVRYMESKLSECPEVFRDIPETDLDKLSLSGEAQALRGIHLPSTEEEIRASRDRLVFDEFFAFLYSVKSEKAVLENYRNQRPLLPSAETVRLIERLPYELTPDQKKAWAEIENDLTGERIMNRLLQGDVGSGKTILAFLSLLLCAANGRQGALMAPTEVLASQHMKNLSELVLRYHLPIRPILLTGSIPASEKKKARKAIEDGSVNVIIGTHALLQDKVVFRDLALAITDEQHRFGVRQRELLSGKGNETPILVMSATPIPRTLALILYGDLNVSVIKTMPGSRLPIKNLALPKNDRGKALRFLLNQIAEGRQAYIICPMIEQNEDDPDENEVESVLIYIEKLKPALPDGVSCAALHGRMTPKEKKCIMSAFSSGDVDILVSTTVIEVGIDVPNAAVMLIEDAERFGLSQLHQIRGRIGRGTFQSYCIFIYPDEYKEVPERLKIMVKTVDGFEIAEEDLKLRGPGDLSGIRQSGEFGFVLGDIYEDAGILRKAEQYAEKAVSENRTDVLLFSESVDFRTI